MKAETPYLPIAKPLLGEEELDAVAEVLRSGWLTQGPWVSRFQDQFAERHGVPTALATTSCTTALHLALEALGVGPGDEVIVPAFSWVATANVVVHCGATPVFVDVLPDTYNIDARAVVEAFTQRTRAIIPVHLFGLCAEMDDVRAACRHEVAIVEDAACAAGAAYRDVAAGALGHVGCFSFHPRKSITCGEGGMLTTADEGLARRAEILRNHGASVPEERRHVAPRPFELPEFGAFGFNYRMTDIQAAVGCVQLQKLDRFIDERAELARTYDAVLGRLGWLTPPARPQHARHALQAYVMRVADDAPISRDDLLERLQEAGIGGRPGTHSIVGLGAYRSRFETRPEDYPVSTSLQADTIALPLHNQMDVDDAVRVAETIAGFG